MTKEKVLEILNDAITYLPSYFCNEECECVIKDVLQENNVPFKFSVENGISKAVILIKGADFVIKLPFSHYYNEDAYCDAHYEWEERKDTILMNAREKKMRETGNPEALLTQDEIDELLQDINSEEPEGSDEAWYYELEGAATGIDAIDIDDEFDWNYCNLEVEIYKAAVEQGLGAYFAEEGYLGELTESHHPVYYQQRCIPLCSLEYDYSSEEYQKKSTRARRTCEENSIDCFNPLWVADFLDHYGVSELRRLNEFIQEMRIGDLRDCNIGYLDGAPILFDYSGFRQWD